MQNIVISILNDIELLSDRAILVSDSEEGSLRTDQMVFPCSPPPPPRILKPKWQSGEDLLKI